VQVVIAGNGEYTLVGNPFDDGNGNDLTNILDSANLPTGSQALTWDPIAGYTTYKKGASAWTANVSLPPGVGFFIRNGTAGGGAPPTTNTFVGSVIVQNGNSVTNQIPLNYSLQESGIPYAGDVAISGQLGGNTNMDFGTPLSTAAQILTWDPVAGYTTAKKAATGWTATVPIAPGQGFFIFNKNGPATNAVETLNLQ